jgi:hypothetical protein
LFATAELSSRGAVKLMASLARPVDIVVEFGSGLTQGHVFQSSQSTRFAALDADTLANVAAQ